jgi:hypothetical protein
MRALLAAPGQQHSAAFQRKRNCDESSKPRGLALPPRRTTALVSRMKSDDDGRKRGVIARAVRQQQKADNDLHDDGEEEDFAKETTSTSTSTSLLDTAHAITSSWTYALSEVLVVLAILALIDCGWSGDWSRIGAATTENEAQARWLVLHLVFPAHVVTSAVTHWATEEKEKKIENAARSFAVGGLTMIKVLAQREVDKRSEREEERRPF